LIIGKGSLKDGSLELKNRFTHEKIIKPKTEVMQELKRILYG